MEIKTLKASQKTKRTAIGEIPVDWEVARLFDVIETLESGTRPKGGVNEETKGFPSFGGENIKSDGGVIYENVNKITHEFYNSMTKGILRNKDVLINKDGAWTGKLGIYDSRLYQHASINEHLFIIRGTPSQITQEFLYYILLSSEGQNRLKRIITGSAQPGLNSSFKKHFLLPIPPLSEQKKIAEILVTVDTAIENTRAVIGQTKTVKKGLMQELLTRGIPGRHKRFKKTELGLIPDEWEVTKLQNVCLKIQDGTHFSPQSKTGPRMYITSKNIRMGYIDLSNVSFISENEHSEIYDRCPVKYGDILLTKDGAQAGNVAVNTIKEKFSLLSSVAMIRPNAEKVLPNYIFHFYAGDYGQDLISNEISGQAITRLTLNKIKKLLILVPKLPEQLAIYT